MTVVPKHSHVGYQ